MRKFIASFLFLLFAATAFAGDTNLPGRLIVQDSDSAPTCSTASTDGTLCVEGATELQSTLSVAGATTQTGAATFASTVDIQGATTLNANTLTGQLAGTFEDLTSNQALDTTDCGAVVSTNDNARVITLPAVAAGNLGCVVTLVNTGADDAAGISFSPNASDAIFGSCVGVTGAGNATVAQASGSDDADWSNTQATANKGDYTMLISDGSTGWYIIGCVGIWTNP